MPVKFKIINILHTLFLVFLLFALAGVILYALEGELLMEVACACVTHFDGQPHTGAGVVKIIEDYSLVPICLVSICVLLIINKVTYKNTVEKYKRNHFMAGSRKAKTARKLFKDEAPTAKVVVEDIKETVKKESRMKLKKFKEKHASTKIKDMPKAVVKDTEKAVAKNLEKADFAAANTTMSQLDELLKQARRK